MSISVRKMRRSDQSAWAEMRYRFWDSLTPKEHLCDIEKMLTSNKRFGYIALEGSQPIGFAEICLREYANGCTKQPVPFLEGIWIDHKHRRRGVGRALLDKIIEDLVVDGFHELCSDAGIKNRRSHVAHKKWGFYETDRVVYFRKPLA